MFLKAGYYHSFVPNTYLAKPGLSPSYLVPARRGAVYLVRFFTVSGLVLMLPFCLFALVKNKNRYAGVYLSALVLAQLAFIIFVGGDVLRFDRFTVPFTPFLLALALMGFVTIRFRRLSLAAAWICVGLIILVNGERMHRALDKRCYHDWMHARVHRQIGLLLADILPSDASIVLNEVGAMSYYSGLKSIDMIGLTEATVGRIIFESYQRFGVSGSEWSKLKIADHLMSRNPTCVVVPAYGKIDPGRIDPPNDLLDPIWAGVYEHPKLAARYHCAFSVSIHDTKHLYFYLLKEIECNTAALADFSSTPCMTIQTY
jgi:hypothetical protein